MINYAIRNISSFSYVDYVMAVGKEIMLFGK